MVQAVGLCGCHHLQRMGGGGGGGGGRDPGSTNHSMNPLGGRNGAQGTNNLVLHKRTTLDQ